VSTGSFVHKKNHSFLLDVVIKLKEWGSKIHLEILGDGPLKNELEKRIDQLNVRTEVHLVGNVDDVSRYLNEAQVYVHSATYEPFGLAILEAMATGLPVVCLDAGGNAPLINDGNNGFLIQLQNADLFAQKILQVTKDSETYLQFCKEARKKAEEFDLKSYTDRLIILYKESLSTSRIQE
jgi:glycosyltransferase involved in cell wall biosynthesis